MPRTKPKPTPPPKPDRQRRLLRQIELLENLVTHHRNLLTHNPYPIDLPATRDSLAQVEADLAQTRAELEFWQRAATPTPTPMEEWKEIPVGNICNYYGGLKTKTEDGKYYWSLDDEASRIRWEEIPECLYSHLVQFAKIC